MKHNEAVSAVSAMIVKPDDSREQVIIMNDDTVRVALAFEEAAVFTEGTFIDTTRSSTFTGDFAKRAIYAITAAAAAVVRVEEI